MRILNIIAPLYNEAENIIDFFEQTSKYCLKLGVSYGYIFVNDGSEDNSLDILKQLAVQHDNVTVIDLSRNFGKEAALTAGIEYSQSKVLIPMDVDLQDPPELIVELYEKYLEGYNMVLAVREQRNTDGVLKRVSADMFYRLINKISDSKMPANAGDFRLIDDKVLSVIKKMPEKTRFMKGILSWPGFKVAQVYYSRPSRHLGETKWSPIALWKLALDGVFSFSSFPLKLWFYIGLSISFMAVVYMLVILFDVVINGVDVPGYASLVILILFLGGVNLTGLGILGEYISRIFIEVKQRPVYVINEVIEADNNKNNKLNNAL